MKDEKTTKNELDSFWDIDSLIPKAKEKNKAKNVSFDTNTVSIEAKSVEAQTANAVKSSPLSIEKNGTVITRFIPPHSAGDVIDRRPPDLEYSRPESLVRKVKIYNWQTKYSSYERFTEDAVRFFKVKGEECPRVPFFAYSPQYSQMNKAQLEWYFWWRSNFRKGEILDTDYSYVLLYAYELINLSEKLDKDYCLDNLCRVWLEYGQKHEFINRYLCEWVCDFCLIHQKTPPIEKIKSLYPYILKNALLKEFYIYGDFRESGIGADTLMAMCPSYDYQKSKYATPDRLPMMEKYMKGALGRVIASNSAGGTSLSGFGFSDSSVTRTSYTGAYCSASVKKRIEVDYCSFSRSYELRYLVADVLRYTENKLRAAWGIRSRLSIYALPTHVRNCIDEYFIEHPIRRADDTDRNGRRIVNEYDRLYDAPKTAFSADNAEKIEMASWDTTKLLVETFEEEEKEIAVVEEKTTVQDSDLKTALGERFEYLLAVLEGDKKKQREITQMPDAIVDEINEIAADILGDIIIEEDDDGGYRVIEEYREVIK